jgi:hypothetical protein
MENAPGPIRNRCKQIALRRKSASGCDSAILLDAKRRLDFPRPAFAFINRRDQLRVRAEEFGTLMIENRRIAGPDHGFGFRIQMVLRYAYPTEEHQFAAMEKRQRFMAI